MERPAARQTDRVGHGLTVHEVNELDDGFSCPQHEVLDHVRGAQVQALPILLDPGLVLPTLNGVLIQSHCRRDACRDILPCLLLPQFLLTWRGPGAHQGLHDSPSLHSVSFGDPHVGHVRRERIHLGMKI